MTGSATNLGAGSVSIWVSAFPPVGGEGRGSYQVAAVFYSTRLAQDRERAVAFMKGYVRASRYYFDAVLAGKEGGPVRGAQYDEVVAVTVRYTEATPEIIRLGFPYQDRDGRPDVQDIGRQLAWYHRTGMITRGLSPRDLIDGSCLDEALRALPR